MGNRLERRDNKMGIRFVCASVILLWGLALPGFIQRAEAAQYPTRAIDLVIPFAAGGSTDLVGRVVSSYVSKRWGQAVNVINKTGASGTTGALAAIQARPDGYTLMVTGSTTTIINLALQKDLVYKWDDMRYVARLGLTPVAVIVKADAPYRTLKDLVDAVKADPVKFKVGTGGIGGSSTFGTGKLLLAAGIDPSKVDLVVFEGGAPTAVAVAGGHIHFASQVISEVISLIRAGKLRALAVSSPQRSADLPDVPTCIEAGYPSADFVSVSGLAGPARLSDAIVSEWERVLEEAFRDKTFAEAMLKTGTVAAYMSARDYTAWTRNQQGPALELAEKLKLRK